MRKPGHPGHIPLEGHSITSKKSDGFTAGNPVETSAHPSRHSVARPSMMVGRFSRMPLSDPELFTIKTLNVPFSGKENPSPPIRTDIHCFIYLQSGEVLVDIGGDSCLYLGGECAVIPAGQIFSIRYYRNCKGFMGGFHTDFLNADNEGKNLLRTFGFLRKWGGHKASFDEYHAAYVTNIFRRLDTENREGKNKDILKAYLTALLVEIDEALKAEARKESDPGTENNLCNRFIEYIFEHPSLDETAASHASRLNVSAAHLQKTVKRLTGKTVLDWISDAVLLEAKVLLSHTDKTVSEIASELGVQDPSYFTRLFRKNTGITPTAYREDLKSTRKG